MAAVSKYKSNRARPLSSAQPVITHQTDPIVQDEELNPDIVNGHAQPQTSYPPRVTPTNILHLQRTLGNKTVRRLLTEQRSTTSPYFGAKSGAAAPTVQRVFTLEGNQEHKARALQLLNSLANGVEVTLVGEENGPWQVQIAANNTEGSKLIKSIVDHNKTIKWKISSDKAAQYDSSDQTVHMKVDAVGNNPLPAKGDQTPEGDYTMGGNEHFYLGHELNHALRHLTGHAKDPYKKEENNEKISDQWVKVQTTSSGETLNYYMQLEEAENIGVKPTFDTGAGAWGGTSENAFLKEQNKAERLGYFKKDTLENKLNRFDYLNSLALTTPIRLEEYKRKKQELLEAAHNNNALDQAVVAVAQEKDNITSYTAKAKAAAKRGTDWLGHANNNIEGKKDNAEQVKTQAAQQADGFDEAAAWTQWVNQNPTKLGNEDDGFNRDWNSISDPDPEDNAAAYNSEWYQKVRAINNQRSQLEQTRTSTNKKWEQYKTLMEAESEADFAEDNELKNLHKEIVDEVENQLDQAEASLITKVNTVFDLMGQEIALLKQQHNQDKPGQIKILENLVKTWRPVTSFNTDG